MKTKRAHHCATGILDFYHAATHLWAAAITYQDGSPARTLQMWFERLHHQLRHGFAHRIIHSGVPQPLDMSP